MDDNTNTGGGASASTDFADRDIGRDPAGSNVPVAQADAAGAGTVDPLAYRNKGQNGRKRAEYMERVVIDMFHGGNVRAFDEAAGLDFNA